MTNQLFPPDLNNPFTRWADLTLRAMDATVSSSQSVGDGIDRVARAAAGAPTAADQATPAAAPEETASPALLPLTFAVALQRTAFDLLANGWLQWTSMLRTMAAASGAAASQASHASAAQPLRSAAGAPRRTARSASSSTSFGSVPPVVSHGHEHAYATSEPARNRGRKGRTAKPRARSSGPHSRDR